MSEVEIVTPPSSEVSYPNGIEVRFFEADDDAKPKVKRHYQLRDTSVAAPVAAWHEVPSVTEAQKILKKEALISWAQRTGANGMIQLYNMGVLKPVQSPLGHPQSVLGSFIKDRGLIIVGEDEALELLEQYRLTTNALSGQAQERGLSCHAALETWAATGLFPGPATFPVSEQGYVAALEGFLRESNAEAVRYEVIVGSAAYGYAGRFDVDIELPKSVELQTHWTPAGRGDTREWFEAGLYRVDLKTGKGVYEEHTEQLEAYEQAAVEDGLPESLARVVLHCADNSRYRFAKSWSVFEDFEATLTKYRANEARKKRKKEAA